MWRHAAVLSDSNHQGTTMERIVIGRLADDATYETFGGGHWERTTFVLLENTGRRVKQCEWIEDDEPTSHRIYAWRQLGDAAKSLQRGIVLRVVGTESTESWADRSGEASRPRIIGDTP